MGERIASETQGTDPPILLFYTLRPGGEAIIIDPTPNTPRATQCMAYSTDGGRTFTKFAGNPILRTPDCRDRDPKVLFHKPTRSWIMVLSLSRNNARRDEATYGIFRSPDLRNWELLQELGPGAWYWECPDMFELPIDGDPARTKWLLVKSSGEYILGAFDGRTFRPCKSERSSTTSGASTTMPRRPSVMRRAGGACSLAG